jgi:alpha-glucosidase
LGVDPTRRAVLTALLLAPCALRADDERRVKSPNGELDFRIFVGQPKGAIWPRVGYEVFYRGRALIATSWMGLDILDQEPYLGENPGFISSDTASDEKAHYRSLIAHYMQNGSLGRRLDVEIRVYDDAVAFRYIMPRSTPLEEVLIRNEATEFNFADAGALPPIAARPDFDLPLMGQLPGIGWVIITAATPESSSVKYPHTYLVRTDAGLQTNLAQITKAPPVAFSGTTPLVWPWRLVMVGPDEERLLQSETLRNLSR